MTNVIFRRGAMAAAALLAGLLRLSGASAQIVDPRPPVVDTSDPQEVAPGVWVVRDYRTWLVPNIGVILRRDAALVANPGSVVQGSGV